MIAFVIEPLVVVQSFVTENVPFDMFFDLKEPTDSFSGLTFPATSERFGQVLLKV